MEPLQVVHLEMVKDGEIFYDGTITTPKELYEIARQVIKYPDRESVYLLGVDGSHTPVFLQLLAVGGITECMVDIRNVFKALLLANCTSFFIWHNHTSLASLASSREDRNITKRLYEAGKLMGIRLEEHLIINGTAYLSIMDELTDEGGLG